MLPAAYSNSQSLFSCFLHGEIQEIFFSSFFVYVQIKLNSSVTHTDFQRGVCQARGAEIQGSIPKSAPEVVFLAWNSGILVQEFSFCTGTAAGLQRETLQPLVGAEGLGKSPRDLALSEQLLESLGLGTGPSPRALGQAGTAGVTEGFVG